MRWSEYRTSIPVFYEYKIIYQGNQPLAVDQATTGSTNLMVDRKTAGGLSTGTINGSLNITAPTEQHQWVLQNVPPLHEEAYTTAPADYEARTGFQLLGE